MYFAFFKAIVILRSLGKITNFYKTAKLCACHISCASGEYMHTCNILVEITSIPFNFFQTSTSILKYTMFHLLPAIPLNFFFGFSFKGKREQFKWNGIYYILILALATIIAVSIALTIVVVRNNEDNDDKTDLETKNMQLHNALPATTTEPDVISTTRGMG